MINKTCIIIIFLPVILFAQSTNFYQTIRGTVVDQTTKTPLPSANVIIVDSNPMQGSSTNINGEFRIEKVPVGRVTIKIGYIGYLPVVLSNVLVYPGKEVVLTVELEQSVLEMGEISVKGEELTFLPLNDMATVSARRFSVEETEKYAIISLMHSLAFFILTKKHEKNTKSFNFSNNYSGAN